MRAARGRLSHPNPSPDNLKADLAQQDKQFARAFTLIRDAIALRTFPGAALAVTHRGALVAAQGFGRFTYENSSPEVQADTIFDLASLTKVVATTPVAMLLYEQGKLSLGESLARTWPDFLTLGPSGQLDWRATVTIRMLLAHSSGLPAYEKLFRNATVYGDLVHAALTIPLKAAPGTRAEYSDIGFILLGIALQAKASAWLGDIALQKIFAPLAMTRTCFNPEPELREEIPPTEDDHTFRHRVIQGEVNDENAFVMNGVAGHAGLFASAPDVARFAECMLRGGSPILRRETVGIFTRRETSPEGTTRALGWDTPSRPESSSGRYFSANSFGHLGYTGTSLWIDPERKLSVTLLTNRTWPDRKSQRIREVRPKVHDAIVQALERN